MKKLSISFAFLVLIGAGCQATTSLTSTPPPLVATGTVQIAPPENPDGNGKVPVKEKVIVYTTLSDSSVGTNVKKTLQLSKELLNERDMIILGGQLKEENSAAATVDITVYTEAKLSVGEFVKDPLKKIHEFRIHLAGPNTIDTLTVTY